MKHFANPNDKEAAYWKIKVSTGAISKTSKVKLIHLAV